ncbi:MULTISPECIES: ABC transporter ATP-binding protein [unclassified Microbacterium]|uniref:ABC transporter ATP-binding protein n=1 Tax=unclassified Microbacterium TaxID=2609290 RepID=UPI00097EAB85|nr:ABC transporter ATP-binding protein [Microbacterium sp. JB110]RCS61360.1 ABC transporter ATP-binding protein [Microbacterium sp. JB110]SJM50445.1 Branched-chain amino acid transport ATP-binding protein LivG (TC 3.A.1.4.1) [Frigoribacterium sp. JB110]
MSVDAGTEPLLRVRDVELSFGGLRVLSDVALDVRAGTIHGLLGPNGAGKTSLFNCISGLYRPQQGSITLSGDELLSHPAHQLSGLGLARTFQHPTLDQHLTVLENVMVGAQSHMAGGFFSGAFRLSGVRRDEKRVRAQAMDLLAWTGLADQADETPGSLPYGNQKLVELARAVVSRPKLLLLDEPAGGLSHQEIDELALCIRALRDEWGMTILLVEHHLGFVGDITDMVDILVEGNNIITAPAAEAQKDPAVIKAYLGQAV